MKKIFSMMMLAGVLAFTACGDDDAVLGPKNLVGQPAAKIITIESADLNFQSIAGTGTVVVNAPDGITKVESDASWCTATFSGNTITVNVEPNDEHVTRVARLRIYSGDTYKDVTVQQMGYVFSINGGDNVDFNAAPQSFDLPISYSGDKEFSVVSAPVDWATFTIEDGVLHGELLVNVDSDERSTEVELSDGDLSTTLTVTQGGLFFTVNDDKDYQGNDGALTQDFPISTVEGIDYTVEPSTVDWATFAIINGALHVVLQPNTTGNPRKTTAVINYAGDLKKEFVIRQFEISDVLGNYRIIYKNSSGSWVYTPATLEKNAEGKYQLRFTSTTFSNMGVIWPVNMNEKTSTITLMNCTELGGTYTKDGTDYSLLGHIVYTSNKDGKNYVTSAASYAISATFTEQEDDSYSWDFELTDDTMAAANGKFYAWRMSYGTGGYSGRVGSYSTYISMYWEKIIE